MLPKHHSSEHLNPKAFPRACEKRIHCRATELPGERFCSEKALLIRKTPGRRFCVARRFAQPDDRILLTIRVDATAKSRTVARAEPWPHTNALKAVESGKPILFRLRHRSSYSLWNWQKR